MRLSGQSNQKRGRQDGTLCLPCAARHLPILVSSVCHVRPLRRCSPKRDRLAPETHDFNTQHLPGTALMASTGNKRTADGTFAEQELKPKRIADAPTYFYTRYYPIKLTDTTLPDPEPNLLFRPSLSLAEIDPVKYAELREEFDDACAKEEEQELLKHATQGFRAIRQILNGVVTVFVDYGKLNKARYERTDGAPHDVALRVPVGYESFNYLELPTQTPWGGTSSEKTEILETIQAVTTALGDTPEAKRILHDLANL